MQQCRITIRLYAKAGDTTGETRHDLGYRRRQGSHCQVPGLAAKTGEDERRRTGKRMVDLTLNETFIFLTCTSCVGRGRRGEPESQRGELALDVHLRRWIRFRVPNIAHNPMKQRDYPVMTPASRQSETCCYSMSSVTDIPPVSLVISGSLVPISNRTVATPQRVNS